MKLKTILAALAVAGVCNAEDFGAGDGEAPAVEATTETTSEAATAASADATAGGAFVESPDGAMAQEQAAMEAAPLTAIEALRQLHSSKYADADTATDRIVVYDEIEFDVPSPDVGPEFIEIRSMKMSALILQAKVKVAESIYSRMSGEQILNRPDAPVDDKIRADMNQVEKDLKIAFNNLSKLGVEYEQAKLDKNAPLTPSERAAVIGNWLGIAKENNLALQLDAKKKDTFEKTVKRYEEAKAKFAELAEAAEAAKPQVMEEMRSNLKRGTQMQMNGGIVLEQAEEYGEADDDGNVSCKMAILFSWSEETEKAAKAVLSGQPLKLKPGKHTLRGWLDKKVANGALAEWLGPRRYIDKEGNLWFVGIAAAPTSKIAAERNRNRGRANLKSAGEVGFALYADVTSETVLEQVSKETQTKPGERTSTKFVDSYTEKMTHKFENLPIFGLKNINTWTLEDPASKQEIIVTVSAVNASAAATMRKTHEECSKKGIALNRWLQRERGRTDRLRSEIVDSRNDMNSYNAGVNAANAVIQTVQPIRPPQQPNRPNYQNPKKPKPIGNGRIGPHSVFHPSDED